MKNKDGRRRFAGRAPSTAEAATSPKQIAMAERRAEVLGLRRKGCSFPTIARQVGTSTATAYRDVVASIAQITREPARELLTLELLRLDDLQRRVYAAALNGDTRAINVLLQIMDRRARLLGLYQNDDARIALSALREHTSPIQVRFVKPDPQPDNDDARGGVRH